MTPYDRMMERTAWFRDARFGLFLHWGLYSVDGRDCWVRSTERMTDEQCQRYFDVFDPVDFRPAEWAKAARRAGMRYAVLTAKHHDGFCLFDSALTDYTSMHAPAGRDLVREYIEAFRAEGLRVGLYYSLLDWHHPDYPAHADPYHPMRETEAAREAEAGRDFDRYLDYLHGQVEELCTNYGQIDLLWFDFSYDDMIGERWRGSELVEKVRRLQPGVMIDNRLEVSGAGFGSLVTAESLPWAGDFVSPEMIIPPAPVRDELGRPVPWESCITMNNHWGYDPSDLAFKDPGLIVKKLVECVSKDGNLLLNVGPDARGRFPRRSVEILDEIGDWMERYSASIHGCGAAPLPKPDWGRYTRGADGVIYAHVFEGPFGPLPLTGIARDAFGSAVKLSDGTDLRVADCFSVLPFPETVFLSMGRLAVETYPVDDDIDTVLAISLREA